MARHLASLPKPLPVKVLRVPDWKVVRALMQVGRRVALDKLMSTLNWSINEGSMDPGWARSTVFIEYTDQGRTWQWRTTLRVVQSTTFLVDPPLEIRPGPAPVPGSFRAALRPDGPPSPSGLQHLEVLRISDEGTGRLFRNLCGADFHLKGGRGSQINHAERVRDILKRMMDSGHLLMTAEGDPGASEVSLRQVIGEPGPRVSILGPLALPPRKGMKIYVSGLMGAELFTFESVVLATRGREALVRKPRLLHRVQRRRSIRYEVNCPNMSVGLWDGANMRRVNQLMDLSEDGIGLSIDSGHAPDVGTATHVVIAIGNKQTLAAPAICVGSWPGYEGETRIGLEFIGIDERTRVTVQRLLGRYGHVAAS